MAISRLKSGVELRMVVPAPSPTTRTRLANLVFSPVTRSPVSEAVSSKPYSLCMSKTSTEALP